MIFLILRVQSYVLSRHIDTLYINIFIRSFRPKSHDTGLFPKRHQLKTFAKLFGLGASHSCSFCLILLYYNILS